jgi:uncharacterized protein YndB with AHSA1/START domain
MPEPHELSVERLIDAPVEAVWKAWTDHLEEWWCPRPWTTELVEQDLRPGGRTAMIMRGPNGEGGEPMEGIFLEVTPLRRIVFTNVVDSNWQTQTSPVANIIGWFEFTPEGAKTRYRAGARHWDEEAMRKHADMGFEQGRGVVAEQLEAVARRIAESVDA